MQTEQKTRLTITETTNLWMQYKAETMDVCVKRHALQHMEDVEIKSLFQRAQQLSEQHVQAITNFLNQEQFPLPSGFSDGDVNLTAPKLYSDAFWLMYIQVMSANGMPDYAIALNTSTHPEVRSYFTQCGAESAEIFNKSRDLLTTKGLLVIPPITPTQTTKELLQTPDLLVNLFGKRMPLNGIEISHIFYNLEKLNLSTALKIGFLQVVQSQEIKDFMTGLLNNVSKKHSHILSTILMDDNITPPNTWASEVTNSTMAPFSDMLMMNHISLLIKSGILFYGAALSECVRKDLAANYTAFISKDLMIYSEAAAIMISEKWVEQPPQTIDHEALART